MKTEKANHMTNLIELFEVPLAEGGVLITHNDPDKGIPMNERGIGTGYARTLGVYTSPHELEITETKSGEPGLFASGSLMLPILAGKGAVILVAAIAPQDKRAWLHLTRQSPRPHMSRAV